MKLTLLIATLGLVSAAQAQTVDCALVRAKADTLSRTPPGTLTKTNRLMRDIVLAQAKACGVVPAPVPPPPAPTPPPPPPPATVDHMFFNSAEVGCGTDANTLLCDDFESGTWYTKNCDQARNTGGLLQTKGWCGTIYNNPPNNAQGSGTGPIDPPGAAVCGNAGFRSQCAATSGTHGGGIGGKNMADHGFSQPGQSEAYFRVYFQPQADYNGGHEKMFDFTNGVGTNQMVALCYNYFGNEKIACIPYLHQDGGLQGIVGGAWMTSNVGPELTLATTHWYFFEMHMRLNTPGQFDGLFEWWLNDCGTDGLACTGMPTLRSRYTTVLFRNPVEQYSTAISGIWIENWANPPTVGTMYYDNVRAAKVGPIGYKQ